MVAKKRRYKSLKVRGGFTPSAGRRSPRMSRPITAKVIKKTMSSNSSVDNFMKGILKRTNDLGQLYKTAKTVRKVIGNLQSFKLDSGKVRIFDSGEGKVNYTSDTPVPSLTTNSAIKRGGGSQVLGKNHKTSIKIGGPLNAAMKTIKRSSGMHSRIIYDSQLSPLSTAPTTAVRQNVLRNQFGFNQKHWTFGCSLDIPRMGSMYNEGGFTDAATGWNKGNLEVAAFRCNVVGTKATHTIVNTSNFFPITFEMEVFYPRDNISTQAQFTDACFGSMAGAQQDNAIPSNDLFFSNQNLISSSGPEAYAGFTTTAPTVRLSDSNFWRLTSIPIQKVRKKLGPNESWTVTIEDFFPNGVDLEKMVSCVENSIPSYSSSRAPVTYMFCLSSWGDKCEAIITDDAWLNEAPYVGTSPGSYTRETRVEHMYLPPTEFTRSSAANIPFTLLQNSQYSISMKFRKQTTNVSGTKLRNVVPGAIGLPNGLTSVCYIPISTDSEVRFFRDETVS